MSEHNIEGFINWFFGFLWDGFSFCFNTLDSLKFRGISLLDFILAIIVISVALPIVLNLLQGGMSASAGYYNGRVSDARSEEKHNRYVAEAEARYQRRRSESNKYYRFYKKYHR